MTWLWWSRLTLTLVLLGLVATNGILLWRNAAMIATLREAQQANERWQAANESITEQLPPHECRSVILPHETCAKTLFIPRDSF
jgi:hypothetical protein